MTEPSKRCCTCHRVLPLTGFNVRRAATDGRQSRCRSCSAQWYQRNRVEHQRNVAARNEEVRRRNRALLIAYLQQHPCVDCGETDVRCLEFDHRDPALKRALVGRLAGWSFNWDRVLEEIAKCDVRCANCHRRRTAAAAGWARDRVQRELDARDAALAGARLQRLLPHPRPSSGGHARVHPGVWHVPPPA